MNPPVVLSSTFVSQGVPGAGEPLYGRMDAATWHPFEETLGTLEGSAHPALVFGSGMAADRGGVLPGAPPAAGSSCRGTPTR